VLSRVKSRAREIRFRRKVAQDSYQHGHFDGGDLDTWIRAGISGYQQWYQHVEFGGGIEAHVTTPPNWSPAPHLNEHSGLDRWNAIIKRNLPDVGGMRVLDLGCNVGLYSIELARLGAREVIGVDRDLNIRQRTGALPRVNLVSQAEFVKEALELREGQVTGFPVIYKAIDFQNLSEIQKLGRFDLILALNVVYHELDRAPDLLKTLSDMTDNIVLQSSIAHPDPIKRWAAPSWNVEELLRNGFTQVTVDSPQSYQQPVITGIRRDTRN
jgi:2-polyprenyl-3-methyl-5-hydroxy-6-metoxy-1,4-benzoquinol methylase